MYMQELLEVAIGLIFMWLALALACMGVQEWIASWFKLRARDLEKAIRQMLEEPTQDDGALPLVDWIYEHRLIEALSKKPTRKPSYISKRTFALVLFDVVMTAGTDNSMIQAAINTWGKKLEDVEGVTKEALKAVKEALPKLHEVVENASGNPELLARLNVEVERIKAQLTAKYPVLGPALDELPQYITSQQIISGLANLAASNPKAAEALNSLMAGAAAFAKEGETVLAAFRTNVETWFNDTMDRLTGWYKRRAQRIAIALGLLFAILLNVDSLVIATTLWREPTIRQALVAQAEGLERPEEEIEAFLRKRQSKSSTRNSRVCAFQSVGCRPNGAKNNTARAGGGPRPTGTCGAFQLANAWCR
jgi:hypothetical protein